MKVGFIGFGEAGFELASGLDSESIDNLVAYDAFCDDPKFGAKVKNRADKANVHLVNRPENVVEKANTIFVAVPTQFALEVCKEIKERINEDILYVDVSASNPDIKKEIDELVTCANGKFVDAAMLGPLTVHQHKVPMVASGGGTQTFIERMEPYGMNIQEVSKKAGDASSIKLLRSIYMKGTAALLIELLEAARTLNVEEPVIYSLEETMAASPFRKTLNQLVTGTSIHAERRAEELEGSLIMLEELKLGSKLTAAVKDKLEYVSKLNVREQFGGDRPEKWETVIDKIIDIK
ncbi:NAD(P)-dependent oxidoreductase [Salicibibacter cibi]|uniref:NAD(P)-dependent oxidoreductase n=1 Tax=Salicibibacter cibi TaxID=2743001 RepID=A0A7T7CH44_9BACI|nr:prephenate dehydrogenase/arogenate dehydrogenase family protein [Salicibibacter cibi]QQK81719.1 NAD(P)-dependent oxidoreductase [Salicibibacter cibi]